MRLKDLFDSTGACLGHYRLQLPSPSLQAISCTEISRHNKTLQTRNLKSKDTGLYRMDRVRSQVHNSGKQIETSTGLNKSTPIDYEDAVIMFIMTEEATNYNHQILFSTDFDRVPRPGLRKDPKYLRPLLTGWFREVSNIVIREAVSKVLIWT
jgi:hypothetical protein